MVQNPRFVFAWLALLLVAGLAFARFADLSPKVDSSFFFSGSSEAVESNRKIGELFDSHEQLVVSAEGAVRSSDYIQRLQKLTDDLSKSPGIQDVKSLVRGPESVEDALESPMWRRLLIGPDENSSLLLLLIERADTGATVGAIEAITNRHNHSRFGLRISGPSYIAEMIRRSLVRDMSLFTGAALVVFSVLLLVVFGSFRIVAGSVVTGLLSVLATLSVQLLCGIPVGVLTANLAVVVFVLAQSHTIFMTGNWSGGPEEVSEAVRRTVMASAWSLLTTLLGFLSLLLVDAEPLRQLGLGGAIGTVLAFATAYLVFPSFMAWRGDSTGNRLRSLSDRLAPFWRRARPRWAAILAAVVILPALFLPALDTDPSLLEYFEEGGEIHESLAYIDARGGSSILNLVVENPDGSSLAKDASYKRMWAMQNALTQRDDVGVIVSLPVLMAEGERHPLSFLIPWETMLRLLRTPRYEEVAKSFVTDDSKKALFILRMREQGRENRRVDVLEQLEEDVEAAGFRPALLGGIYFLQAHLADQVGSSLIQGLVLLVVLFAGVGYLAAGSVEVAVAMTGTLLVLALGLLGTLALFGVPIDIISAPASNVALGLAVDAMVHLTIAARRTGDLSDPKSWAAACSEQSVSILTAGLVVTVGFGLFGLSTFPPTQRFGLAIAAGSAVAAGLALFVLPSAACARRD